MRRGKATVTVSALNTLWDLKLRILEALSVHPRNADVYCLASGKWAKLDNDDASLAGTPQSCVFRVDLLDILEQTWWTYWCTSCQTEAHVEWYFSAWKKQHRLLKLIRLGQMLPAGLSVGSGHLRSRQVPSSGCPHAFNAWHVLACATARRSLRGG